MVGAICHTLEIRAVGITIRQVWAEGLLMNGPAIYILGHMILSPNGVRIGSDCDICVNPVLLTHRGQVRGHEVKGARHCSCQLVVFTPSTDIAPTH